MRYLLWLCLACGCTSPTWLPDPAQARVTRREPLYVVAPPGHPALFAERVLDVLEAGLARAAPLGLAPRPFAAVVLEREGGSYLPGRMTLDGRSVAAYPLPVPAAAALAGEHIAPEVMPLVLLEVHELFHVLCEAQLRPTVYHLWLNEGLAEMLAYHTGRELAPDGLRAYLGQRLASLDTLPAGGTVDFLRWSPPAEEARFATTAQDGSTLRFGWSSNRDHDEMSAAVEKMREAVASGALDAREWADERGLWDEWLAVLASPPGATEIAVDSGDRERRWGVYALLLAFFLEAEAAGAELGAWLTWAAPEEADAAKVEIAPGMWATVGGSSLARTNRALLDYLSEACGEDLYARARAYPVARARKVLARALSELP